MKFTLYQKAITRLTVCIASMSLPRESEGSTQENRPCSQYLGPHTAPANNQLPKKKKQNKNKKFAE